MLPPGTRPTLGDGGTTHTKWGGKHKTETRLKARDTEPPIKGGSGSWKRELLGSWGQGVACNKHTLQGTNVKFT